MSEWDDAIEAFIVAQRAANIAPTSCVARRQHLGHMARRVLVGPWRVTTDDVAGYMASQNWAQETRRSRRTTFVEFYRWAVATGRTSSDPMAAIARIKAADPLPRPVPDRVYLEALMRADDVEAEWIDLAAEHGLRRAEIAQVHSRDVVETLLGYDLVVHGKGGKVREVPLTAAMARALLKRVEDQGRGYLYRGEHNGHVSPQWLGIRVARLLGGNWTAHKLRHRAATRFYVSAGGDPYVVADLMGWANINMVKVYVKLPDERRRAVVEGASRAGARLTALA